MKRHFIKRVKVCGQLIEVTKAAPKIYQITFVYDDGYEEIFYRGFYDEDDVRCYCIRKECETNGLFEFSYEFVTEVKFEGGNEDE